MFVDACFNIADCSSFLWVALPILVVHTWCYVLSMYQTHPISGGGGVCDTAVIDTGLRRSGVSYLGFLILGRGNIAPE